MGRAARWASPGWRAEATTWLDGQLAAVGLERTGEVEQPHLRPWATALRAPTSAGPVWLKAPGPGTAYEVRLYPLLARVAPDRVLLPIAVDAAREWILLPDGGPSLRARPTEREQAEGLAAALVPYAELQRRLAPYVDEMLALGVADMRPAVMPARFAEALDVTGATLGRRGPSAGDDERARDLHRKVAALAPQVADWCSQLAASPLGPSLDHNDLHPGNVLAAADDGPDVRFYDWGDGVLAHPFAALLVPLGFVRHHLGLTVDDPRFTRFLDAYLDVFADLAPGEDLTATAEIACRVAKIARVLTWERALHSAREEGDEIPPAWSAAPLETLASLLDDSYLLPS